MSPEAQRIAIAEFEGYIWPSDLLVDGHRSIVADHPVRGRSLEIPDYLHDLNAMDEAENLLTDEQKREYFNSRLFSVAHRDAQMEWGTAMEFVLVGHATATQRAEALLRTIGKWVEPKP